MLLPYRAKNPPERFPYVTVGLIVLNVLIYIATSDGLLGIREEVVNQFAISHKTFSPLRVITSMFLHGNIEHIIGNMLALWLFGASLEGRLGHIKYIIFYLICGMAGDLLHEVTVGLAAPEQFSLGASGAIMGLAGGYIYVFPYSTICTFWMFYFRGGVAEIQARWIVLFYIGSDLFSAFLGGGDGIGHFAHLGGFAMGLLTVFLLKIHRDSEETSIAQANRADLKDYTLLSLPELEALLQKPTEDLNLVLAYCEKTLSQYGGHPAQCLAMLNYYARPLIERGDPERIAYILLNIHPSAGGMPPVFSLRLASRLERQTSNDLAAQVYRRIYDTAPNAPETEVALFRLGHLMQNVFHNQAYAQMVYGELFRLFPNGEMALQARRSLPRS